MFSKNLGLRKGSFVIKVFKVVNILSLGIRHVDCLPFKQLVIMEIGTFTFAGMTNLLSIDWQ